MVSRGSVLKASERKNKGMLKYISAGFRECSVLPLMAMELDLSYVRSPGLLELEAKLPLRLAGDRGREVEEAPHFLKLLARIAEKVEPTGRLQVGSWI